MKKNKTSIIVFLIIALVLIISISFGIYHFAFSKSLDSSDIKYNNAREVVEGYFEALLDGNYSRAYKYIYIPNDSFINKNDYIYYMHLKDYYENLSTDKLKEIEQKEKTLYQVTLIDKDDNIVRIDIKLIQRAVNDFRINESEIFETDWMVSIPKNTNLYIDEMLVEKSLIRKSSDTEDLYLLPAIANSEKIFKLENTLGNREIKITPSEDNSGNKIKIVLDNDEIKNNAYEFIKNTWNALYNEYLNNDNIDGFKQYFVNDYSENNMKKYFNGFDSISHGATSISQNIDYRIDEIKSRNDIQVLSDELISVDFGYKLIWKWKNRTANTSISKSMNRYSSMILKIDGDSFKIYKLDDEGLFNYASEYTRDF